MEVLDVFLEVFVRDTLAPSLLLDHTDELEQLKATVKYATEVARRAALYEVEDGLAEYADLGRVLVYVAEGLCGVVYSASNWAYLMPY